MYVLGSAQNASIDKHPMMFMRKPSRWMSILVTLEIPNLNKKLINKSHLKRVLRAWLLQVDLNTSKIMRAVNWMRRNTSNKRIKSNKK